jgi:hypothetical protein
MRNKIIKILSLIIAIIIPLILTFISGKTVYKRENLRADYRTELLSFGVKDPTCNIKDSDECKAEYSEAARQRTTLKKIEAFMAFGANNQYISWDETPIFNDTLTYTAENDEVLNLYKFLVYRTVLSYDVKLESGDTESRKVWQYIFFQYDINYTNIRRMVSEIENIAINKLNNVTVPTLAGVKAYNTGDVAQIKKDIEDGKTTDLAYTSRSLSLNSAATTITDYESVPTFNKNANEGVANKINIGWFTFNIGAIDTAHWYEKTDTVRQTSFEFDFKVVVDSSVVEGTHNVKAPYVTFDSDVITGEILTAGEDNGLRISPRQDVIKAGFFGWAFAKYMWWIGIIVLVISGGLTAVFYLMMVYEIKERETKKLRSHKRR